MKKRLTLLTIDFAFDSFFGGATGFFDCAFGDGDGDGDGEAVGCGVGAAVGLGPAATSAAGGPFAIRERTASVPPISSNAATTAATTLSRFFAGSEPLREKDSLGKDCFAAATLAAAP